MAANRKCCQNIDKCIGKKQLFPYKMDLCGGRVFLLDVLFYGLGFFCLCAGKKNK